MKGVQNVCRLVVVDLAKSVFQIAVADANWKPVESHRLTRTQFARWFANRELGLAIMDSLRLRTPLGAMVQRAGNRSQTTAGCVYRPSRKALHNGRVLSNDNKISQAREFCGQACRENMGK
jgi:hypothetical protein